MKKILFISPLPPPNYGSAVSSKMCLEILRKDPLFEVHNIKINFAEEFSDIGKITFSKLWGVQRIKNEIKDYFKKETPDLVYIVPATYGLGLIREYLIVNQIKRFWNKKIVFHVRSRITESNKNNKMQRTFYKKIFPNQKIIVLDESLKKDFSWLTSKENIFVLPNAIKNEISNEDAKKIIKERKKRDRFNLLFLSNMEESKGWFKLLKACKLLHEKKIDFKCNFVGSWPSKKEKLKFEKYVSSNNLINHVRYLGKKEAKEKIKIFEQSDILVYPTELDTFGKVIIEAMMVGLPVIANGIAAIPTTVQDKKTGFILNENSPEEIAEKIIKLKDKNLRNKMGLEGRKRFLEYYEQESYAKKFTKLIKNLM
ncbi:glycosyltransferase family 4 protein [Candidatus Pacearchaeota archaeon]|nr:glycosyltransferase family 4 protein [Candidatus Pacearchaeota archaeon]